MSSCLVLIWSKNVPKLFGRLFGTCLVLYSVWPDGGIWSSPIFHKSCPKSRHCSFYTNHDIFQKNQNSTVIWVTFARKFAKMPVKNSPIWSHWLPSAILHVKYQGKNQVIAGGGGRKQKWEREREEGFPSRKNFLSTFSKCSLNI